MKTNISAHTYRIVFLIVLITYGQSYLIGNVFSQDQGQTVTVSILTDNVRYVAGTPIRVSGEVFVDNALPNKSIPVILSAKAVDFTGFLGSCVAGCSYPLNQNISTSVALATNGIYNSLLPPISQPGHYIISAAPEFGNYATSIPSAITIEIQDLFYTRTFLMLYTGLGVGLIGLMFVILRAPRIIDPPQSAEEYHSRLKIKWRVMYSPLSQNTYALLRFLFLSVIAVTLMIAFALTDVQIAPLSPFGLVIKTDPGNTTLVNNQWVVNIGGIVTNNYGTGVQVPVSVIIFGVAGGYLRFLYYTSTKGLKQLGGQQVKHEESFYETLKDLSLFFLAPLLAVAVWLVLFQTGNTSILTLSAVSFTVGLVTREVVEVLVKFVTSIVSTISRNGEENGIHDQGTRSG